MRIRYTEMRGAKRVVACVAVAVLVVSTGCIGGGEADVGAKITPDIEPADTEATGDEILASALDTAEGADTYRVESETRMDLASFFGISMNMNTTGEFDEEDNVSHTQSEGGSGAELLGMSGGEAFETEVYRTGDARYTVRTNGTDETGEVNRTAPGEPLSPGADYLVDTVEGADATVEGVGEVGGEEAYVLSLDLGVGSLGSAFSRAIEDNGPARFGDGEQGGDPSEGSVNTSEAYLWVDRETSRPLRFAYLLNLRFEGDGEDEVSGSMEIFGDTRYTGYGEGIEVGIPERFGR
jgi:hypothetical protein